MKKKHRLKINCFYKVYGGQSHPAFIFAYVSDRKTYLSFKFGTTQGRHMTEIHPIQQGYLKSFVRNRPFEGTRDDYGDEELIGLHLDSRDKEILESIKLKQPDRSIRARKRYKKKSQK